MSSMWRELQFPGLRCAIRRSAAREIAASPLPLMKMLPCAYKSSTRRKPLLKRYNASMSFVFRYRSTQRKA
eukprot:scaffold181972_cov22-Prasinocladus_malaysianus.AAC.1